MTGLEPAAAGQRSHQQLQAQAGLQRQQVGIQGAVGGDAVEMTGQFGQVRVDRQQWRYRTDGLDQLRLGRLRHAQAVADYVGDLAQLTADRINQQARRRLLAQQHAWTALHTIWLELEVDLRALRLELQADLAEQQIDPHIRCIGPEQSRMPDQAEQGLLGRQFVARPAIVVIATELDLTNGLGILLQEKIQTVAVLEQALEGHGAALAPLALGAELLLAWLDIQLMRVEGDEPGQPGRLLGLPRVRLGPAGLEQGQRRECMLPGFLALVDTDQRHKAGQLMPVRLAPRLGKLPGQQGIQLLTEPVVTRFHELIAKAAESLAPNRLAYHLGIRPVQPQGQQQAIEAVERQRPTKILIRPPDTGLLLLDQQLQSRVSPAVILFQAQADCLLERRVQLLVGTGQQQQAIEPVEYRREIDLALLALPLDRLHPLLHGQQRLRILAT